MVKKLFILTVFSLVCFTSNAQIDDFQKEIIEYLNSNGTRSQYNSAFDEVFPLLKRNFEKFDIPEKEWDKLKEDKKTWIDKIVAELTFAYRGHFTRDDIKQMTAFYKSEAGKKMVNKEKLTSQEQKEVDAYLNGKISKKVADNFDALSKDIETISTEWSRELFGAKMSQLIKDGYVY